MADPFPDSVRQKIYQNAGGKCERCGKKLGNNWEAHHRNSNGASVASNGEALCPECHQNTRSYGRPK